jgi:hypothetical protein
MLRIAFPYFLAASVQRDNYTQEDGLSMHLPLLYITRRFLHLKDFVPIPHAIDLVAVPAVGRGQICQETSGQTGYSRLSIIFFKAEAFRQEFLLE